FSASSFFFAASCAHADLHSFPTRRSSDLGGVPAPDDLWAAPDPRGCDPICVGADAALGQHAVERVWELVDPRLGVSELQPPGDRDRKSTRLNSSHVAISYAVFCLKKKITE